MGMESERSEEERAKKIRDRLIIFRIAVPAAAEKKSWPRTGNPLIAETVNNRPPTGKSNPRQYFWIHCCDIPLDNDEIPRIGDGSKEC
jgi:hypothetical protein